MYISENEMGGFFFNGLINQKLFDKTVFIFILESPKKFQYLLPISYYIIFHRNAITEINDTALNKTSEQLLNQLLEGLLTRD